MAKVGDLIEITYMGGEPQYEGREGTITRIDDMGQLHGTWGGLAVIPGEDSFRILSPVVPQQFQKRKSQVDFS